MNELVIQLLENAEYQGDGYVRVLAYDAENLRLALDKQGFSVQTEIQPPNED